MPKIKIAKKYEPIFTSKLLDFILPGGRVSGKSKHAYIVCALQTGLKPNEDIVVCRVSYGSIADSVYNEVREAIETIPAFDGLFEYKKSPLRIVRKDTGATIYFLGIGGSIDRTKGFNPLHKVGLVILEETQELKSKEHYDQTLASLRRRFGNDCKVITIFNPPAQSLHWINIWCAEKEKDADCCVIHSTYEDVLPFLSDRDLKEIRKTKYESPAYHDYIYGGIPTGNIGAIYPMFRADLHLIPYDKRESSRLLQDFRICGVVCGCDGAVIGVTAIVPMFLMSNGQMVAGKIFYHNPLTDGVKGSFPLCENEIMRWFKELRVENNLDNEYDYMQSVPIMFVVDSAATELIQALNYYFGNRANVYSIKKGTILQMVDVVQSTIGKNVACIYDYGGYFNYTSNMWLREKNLLADQIQKLAWNEKQNGYDPIIPNDVSDAFTYAVYFWMKDTTNITWRDEIKNIAKDYYLLKNR